MPFINTRDTYNSDDECLVALITDNIEDFKDDGVTVLRPYGLANLNNLKSVHLPNITSISASGFASCINLETVNLGSSIESINNTNIFADCYKLKSIFIENENAICILGAPNSVFPRSLYIDDIRIGCMYVPSALLSSYKNANNWSTISDRIRSISEYPCKPPIITVDDTWAQIISHAANGTHSTAYNKGDIKELSYNNKTAYMQYVGDRPEGPVWLSKINEEDTLTMYPTSGLSYFNAELGYLESTIDEYLNTTLYAYLPSEIQTAIAEVPITYSISAQTYSGNRKIWIPSSKELGFTGGDCKENSGYVFNDVFTDNNSRKMYNLETCQSTYYHVRSMLHASAPMIVSGSGTINSGSIYQSCMIRFGFVLSGPST